MTDGDAEPTVAELRATLADRTARIDELAATLKDAETRISHQRERVDQLEGDLVNKDRRIEALATSNDQLWNRLSGVEDDTNSNGIQEATTDAECGTVATTQQENNE
ncbi:uncharacterized protein Nmlp_1151 [Natronomonas moolapensis 8.8.11]|uniref:Uncharacterized protein n=1 Tax=Natronomonas moolapensis (strain DSM 18674 / CECT 7526 / JCM 14361 / 8.8.11) TaxID=268739 RepID=M1XN83_NATM8|nr:hypothetical protein [Natronomonas moolapensis]CCQ35361.1 uncharacterized protein Nmlp_1151 [Natronomonas moolapensis 8.8.11]